MNENERDNRFLEAAQRSLRDSEVRIEPGVLGRLETIRRQALEASERGESAFFAFPLWAKAGAFATAAAAMIVLFVWTSSPRHDLPVRSAEEFEIVMASDQMDLFEDLEFYEWLDAEAAHSSIQMPCYRPQASG